EWPENGGKWSDTEEDPNMDCQLQAMAEEDEEINIYNDETFGMPPPPAPPSLDNKVPPLPCSPSPPIRQVSRTPPGRCNRGRGLQGTLGRGQMFEDPAVMRMVEGRPSIKTLDSAIVDCGSTLYRKPFEENWMGPTHKKTQKTSQSILEDSAIVCVINGHRGRGQNLNCDFIDLPPPVPFFRGRRGEPRGSFFIFPSNRPCPSTPKMMQLRFGANSPRPSPFYSPSSNPVQYPDPVTQLHPHHKRQLVQKQRMFQKSEGWDPWCNLMTAKEKEWITRLQMIQLQSENPYLEDYYYQEYYRRLEAKLAEEELGIRGKKEPPKLTTPYITKTDAYTPVHIEGSLGQVAVSTCYSPRRAISAVHAQPAYGQHEEDKDTRQQRLELLSKIEKQLFIVLLEVEETERTKTKVLSDTEERRLMEKTQRKVDHIWFQMQHHDPNSTGEFLPFLLLSKGKKLIARLLPFLKRDLSLKILQIVTCNLPTLMNRDSEESLPVLYPPFRNVIGGLTFSQLIGILRDLTSSEAMSAYECLALTCQNKFGLSLLYALLSQGEKLLSSGVPLEPSIGDFEATDTIYQVAGQLSQCSLVEPLLLPSNLLTLFCRYLDKRTVYQLKSNM
uniref:mRNA decay factor PAT1 domain-containing protein n=1 Tax=Periophthalmus magnuspinnatus TaxID=409849 RepID=A0A3B4AN05_9GOBI